MIDLLGRDLEKEMTEAMTQEENSQKEYEMMMQDSAAKRAKAVKSVDLKESEKAEVEEAKVQDEGSMEDETRELAGMQQYEIQLHGECDWLLQNFDLRKTARAEEMTNLEQAKAVLSGADFTFLQASSALLARSRRHH